MAIVCGKPGSRIGRVALIRAAKGPVTLLFAARQEVRNNATVLRDWLLERLP